MSNRPIPFSSAPLVASLPHRHSPSGLVTDRGHLALAAPSVRARPRDLRARASPAPLRPSAPGLSSDRPRAPLQVLAGERRRPAPASARPCVTAPAAASTPLHARSWAPAPSILLPPAAYLTGLPFHALSPPRPAPAVPAAPRRRQTLRRPASDARTSTLGLHRLFGLCPAPDAR